VTSARRFRCQLESVPAAREFVRDALSEHSRDLREVVELMTSELVTNSLQHAQTCFELTIDDAQRQIRVEVRDSGGGRPVPRSPAPTERTGRGLRIVEALSGEWGIEQCSSGKTVWFTIGRS
jgi:anti-sigma regulatory factor (Ser/Thr protein kinase)